MDSVMIKVWGKIEMVVGYRQHKFVFNYYFLSYFQTNYSTKHAGTKYIVQFVWIIYMRFNVSLLNYFYR